MKHTRDSWQTWENYAAVAVRVQQWQPAIRALAQVLALSAGQRTDLTVLSALVAQVEAGRRGEQQQEQQASAAHDTSDAAVAAEGATPADDSEAAAGEGEGGGELAELATALGELSTSNGTARGSASAADAAAAAAEAVQKADARAQEVLEQSVGQLMKQVAATASGDSAFWEAYARCVWLPAEPSGLLACASPRPHRLLPIARPRRCPPPRGWPVTRHSVVSALCAPCETYTSQVI